MKIGLYSPYVPKHTGGGEKFFFDVARILTEEGHQVVVGVPQLGDAEQASRAGQLGDAEQIRQKYEQFLNVSLQKVNFVATPLGTSASFWQKLIWTKQFDVLYYVTDGSLFFSFARKNILHIQFPFTFAKTSLIDRLKLANWTIKNTNSEFTKKVIEKSWAISVPYVHQPMISPDAFQTIGKKQKIILHVGRFFRQLHSKRQDVLVEVFQQLVAEQPKLLQDWQLVLVGSVEDESYAAEVAKKAKGLPIKLVHQVSRQELLGWYQKASIYWHATGYQVDQEKEPEKTEHFGISTGEAMASGCVPVVLGKGGQPEVVGPKFADLMWSDKQECIQKTLTVISAGLEQMELRTAAQNQAKNFNQERFRSTLLAMVQQ